MLRVPAPCLFALEYAFEYRVQGGYCVGVLPWVIALEYGGYCVGYCVGVLRSVNECLFGSVACTFKPLTFKQGIVNLRRCKYIV